MTHIKYLFHPKLEIIRCNKGVLSGCILGDRISFSEKTLDGDFALFILENLKLNRAFSADDLKKFFLKRKKIYNFGKILQGLEKRGFIYKADQKETDSIVLVNLTEIPNEILLHLSEEVPLKSRLKLIHGMEQDKALYQSLGTIRENQIVFILSDFIRKYKLSEINLYLYKRNIYWCPILMDGFGGYIGPLMLSGSVGPCFNCYEKKIYKTDENTNKEVKAITNIFLRTVFIEILKIDTHLSPSPIIYSNLLELDCLNHRSRKHYIYANSHCVVCGE